MIKSQSAAGKIRSWIFSIVAIFCFVSGDSLAQAFQIDVAATIKTGADLPKEKQAQEYQRFNEVLLNPPRDDDGTWNDRIFPQSRSYGTSMSVLALLGDKVPIPNENRGNQENSKPDVNISQEAMEIHMSGMLFDGHNDLPWMMRERGGSSFDKVDISKPTKFHTDIPRLRKGGLKAQFWSVYVPADTDKTGRALIETLEQIQLVHDMCQRYPDVFEMANTAADIERISKAGKIASMIGVEGGHSIQGSLQVLGELYDRGARYMTLTHSKTLAWADSATDDPKNNGLSPFGKEVVREMNRIGMLIDLSHVSPKCMKDALAVTEAPVIFSHSSARALCDVPRNVPDDVLKLTAENGGVVMVNFYSGYIVPTEKLPKSAKDKKYLGDVKTVCDHIDHIAKIAGIDHVGIGSDYDGVSFLPQGLEDVSGYPNITQELLNRGYDKAKIHKVLGGNILRALKEAEQVSERLKVDATSKKR